MLKHMCMKFLNQSHLLYNNMKNKVLGCFPTLFRAEGESEEFKFLRTVVRFKRNMIFFY